jgi:hypothetical protein
MVTGMPVSDPTVQVYFATATRPEFAEARSLKIRGIADGQVRTYRAYFGGNPDWKGQLSRLRVDPAGPGTTGGVRIDRVRLVKIEPGSEQFTTLTEPADAPLGPGRSRNRL